MKKLLLFAGVMFLFASLAMAQADFSPSILEITCPAEISYDFGDESLNVPFSVSGVPGAFWLVISTHGKADEIVDVENGFLGWHYVNNIDTTVYVSGRYQRELGDVKIAWDGTSSDGGKVAEDTYAYYLWGYDDKNAPQTVSDWLQPSGRWSFPSINIVEIDEQGMPLEKPLVFGMPDGGNDDEAWRRYGCAFKWEIGANPEDFNNLATSWCPFYPDKAFKTAYKYGQPVLDLQDNDFFYNPVGNYDAHVCSVMKWKFISGGDAELEEDWMGWDTDSEWMTHPASVGGRGHIMAATSVDGTSPYLYVIDQHDHMLDQPFNPLTCINMEEGEVTFNIQMDEHYMPDDGNEREINGSPKGLYTRSENKIGVYSWLSCMQEMVDVTEVFEDPYYQDYVVWQNKNGDIFLDKMFWEDAATPWACIAGFTNDHSNNGIVVDANGFSMVFRAGLGTVTNTILTPDGTGIADLSYFGADYIGYDVCSNTICDSGSQYDGMYVPPNRAEESTQGYTLAFVTFDSAGGLIIPGAVEPGVEEGVQSAYALEQNAPNPFNPTTTIGFTLAEAGDVTIDVYNVAGQKVDTLVSGFVESGSHSVVWDASGFSAGVYFYTVKSGDFSRTMKMTLLK